MNYVTNNSTRILERNEPRYLILLKILGLPFILFVVDLGLRILFGLDVVDAGADMALLGVSAFLALLIEDLGSKNNKKKGLLHLCVFVFSIYPWIYCLYTASPKFDQPLNIHYFVINWRIVFGIISWTLGLVFLGASAVIIYLFTQIEQIHN